MKKIYYILSALFLCVVATSAQEAGKTVVIKTNVGTMKAILYDDVPNHTRTFIERAKRGDFNGTLFTRVLPEFMIQGGALIPRMLCRCQMRLWRSLRRDPARDQREIFP